LICSKRAASAIRKTAPYLLPRLDSGGLEWRRQKTSIQRMMALICRVRLASNGCRLPCFGATREIRGPIRRSRSGKLRHACSAVWAKPRPSSSKKTDVAAERGFLAARGASIGPRGPSDSGGREPQPYFFLPNVLFAFASMRASSAFDMRPALTACVARAFAFAACALFSTG
jgi:hypothetical protein